MTKFTTILVLLASTAWADNPPYQVGEFVGALDRAKHEITSATKHAADCTKYVAEARAAGAATLADSQFEKLPDGTHAITLDRADQLCSEYARYEAVAARLPLFDAVARTTSQLTLTDHPAPEFVNKALAQAEDCVRAFDELAGNNLEFVHFGKSQLVGELRALCDAETAAAKQYTKDEAAAVSARHARFAKAGIAGDKLDMMLKNDGTVFLAGGDSSPDLRRYAKASVLFVWLTSDPDAENYVVHTVRRYQFDGNRLVRSTEKTYRKPHGAKLGDVFR